GAAGPAARRGAGEVVAERAGERGRTRRLTAPARAARLTTAAVGVGQTLDARRGRPEILAVRCGTATGRAAGAASGVGLTHRAAAAVTLLIGGARGAAGAAVGVGRA